MLRVSVSQTLELFLFQFFSSLKFHQAKVLGPMQALGEVMGLGKAMGKAGHAKAHGGGGEAMVHGAHRRREGSQARRVQLVLQHHVVLLLQTPALLGSPVLKPYLHLQMSGLERNEEKYSVPIEYLSL